MRVRITVGYNIETGKANTKRCVFHVKRISVIMKRSKIETLWNTNHSNDISSVRYYAIVFQILWVRKNERAKERAPYYCCKLQFSNPERRHNCENLWK